MGTGANRWLLFDGRRFEEMTAQVDSSLYTISATLIRGTEDG